MDKTSSRVSGVYRFEEFGKKVLIAYSGREFDMSSRPAFLEALSIPIESLKLLNQEHTDHVIPVTSLAQAQRKEVGDSMITDIKDMALGILTADCIPIVFYSQKQEVVGIAHAGWRGLQSGILKKVIEEMVQKLRVVPNELKAHIGPSIRKCCYQTGDEFQSYFPHSYHDGYTDLIDAAKRDLTHLGIKGFNVYDSEICTSCSNKRFYSARQEKGTLERMLSVAMLRS